MRLKFQKSKQKELIDNFKKKNNLTWKQFSNFLDVTQGALISWHYEKNLLPLKIYKKIDKSSKYQRYIQERLKDNWGQIKAGLNSRGSLKKIKIPKKSAKLAELIGILLGDGNIHYFKKGKKIGSYMVRIAGDKRHEKDYFENYISNLIRDLFNIEPKIELRKSNEMLLIIHSKKMVEFFISQGLKSGDKIKNKVTIPKWIFEKDIYLKACIRGLIDTDGCIYTLKPHYPNYYQMNFKNFNMRLLKDTRKAFLALGYPISKISKHNQLYLTQKAYIRKFYKEIGFSNLKHQKRYHNSPMV
jgi:intein/homing endonuclease